MGRDSPQRKPSLRGQLLKCLLFCVLAVIISLILQPGPAFQLWQSGESIATQAGFVAMAALIYFAVASIALRLSFIVKYIKLPSWLEAVDLSGWNPLLIGLAAGIGEELLFRAALLPLLGLWLSSALFAVAHLRTAQLAARPLQQFGYIVNTFLAGIALGLVFVHIGLLAAIGVHVIIDVVGLWAVQQLQYRRRAATAT